MSATSASATRESRAEDLATIASLRERVAKMDAERDEGEAQREQLRLELRAREKNQNVFGAGAATRFFLLTLKVAFH